MDIQQPLKDKLLPVNCIEFFLIAKIRNRAAYLFTVAQIFNPPHRRVVIGRTLLAAGRWQVKNLRYSRLQVCATGAASTLNKYMPCPGKRDTVDSVLNRPVSPAGAPCCRGGAPRPGARFEKAGWLR